jgi:hypothetical protein
VGHYHLDGKGFIKDNDFLVCGNVPGYPQAGYFPQKLGETARYNAPSGKTLFTLTTPIPAPSSMKGLLCAAGKPDQPGIIEPWDIRNEYL